MREKLLTWLTGFILIVGNGDASAYEMLRHNPFEQPAMTAADWGTPGNTTVGANMELRGTVIDGKDSMANIGGEYYRLNEEIAGYRVTRIENGSVTLSHGGYQKVLTLHDDE